MRIGPVGTLTVTPGVSYIKDASFVPAELAEKWPAAHRTTINAWAAARARPTAQVSAAVVEAGVYESDAGAAVVLANFTYEPIEKLTVRVPVRGRVTRVHSASTPDRPIAFRRVDAYDDERADGYAGAIEFTTVLGLDDIIVLR